MKKNITIILILIFAATMLLIVSSCSSVSVDVFIEINNKKTAIFNTINSINDLKAKRETFRKLTKKYATAWVSMANDMKAATRLGKNPAYKKAEIQRIKAETAMYKRVPGLQPVFLKMQAEIAQGFNKQ